MSWHFTNEEDNYIKENYTSKTIYQIAQALGRPKTSVGYHLQTVLKLKIPAEVYQRNKQLRKIEANKLKAANANKKREEKSAQKLLQKQTALPKLVKPVSRKDNADRAKKFLKPPVIKIADHSNLIPLRINNKTILYIKPGADIAAIKKQYCIT